MELIITNSKQDQPDRQKSRRYIYRPLPKRLAYDVNGLSGVDYTSGHLRFDTRLLTDADLVERCCKSVRFQGQGRPAEVTQDDLKVINERLSSVNLSARCASYS